MRLLTYNRGGARRLGAWVQDAVVDLPDAVGHPAFPTTMEALVARNGGTTLDAARTALSQPCIVEEFQVPGARLLSPYEPRWAGSTIVGPDEELRLVGLERVKVRIGLACVLRRQGQGLTLEEAQAAIFGYALFARFSGGSLPDPLTAVGPYLVSSEEIDGPDLELVGRIAGGGILSRGVLAEAGTRMAERIAAASRRRELRTGEVFAMRAGPAETIDSASARETRVEVESPALGVLAVSLRSG